MWLQMKLPFSIRKSGYFLYDNRILSNAQRTLVVSTEDR
jgi:hypothetical protein